MLKAKQIYVLHAVLGSICR